MSQVNRPVPVVVMLDVIGVQGGAEKFAVEATVALDREKFSPTVCVTRWGPDAEDSADVAKLEASGVPLIGMKRRSRFDFNPWRDLAASLRGQGTMILHTHMFGSNFWGAVLAPRVPVPVLVAHEHSWSFEGRPVRKYIDKHLIARNSDAFIAVSEHDRRKMIEVEGIDPTDIRYIPNGIAELPEPTPGRDLRAELGLSRDIAIIGLTASLLPVKAIDVLLRAVAELKQRGTVAHVLIAGGDHDSGHRGRLEAEAAELGITDAVTFLGPRDDVADIVDACDICALSSTNEGSPLSILEYMAAGRPVVATAVGGVPDLIDDGVTGTLVERGDSIGMATAFAALIESPELRRKMGEAGRERLQEEFTIAKTARRIEDLYDELLLSKLSEDEVSERRRASP